ncbi:MAG: thiamine diphosphokinase [Bacillota bacterium]
MIPVFSGEYAVIVGGGDVSDLLLPFVRGASMIIAADSGAEFLESHGLTPGIFVGDFDSCGRETVCRVRASGCRVVSLPVEKDVTDSEAALNTAFAEGFRSAVVIGALGGDRIEHGIANLLLVERYAGQGMDVVLASPKTWICHVSGPGYAGFTRRAFRGRRGDWVSLFPITESAKGVTTENLKFPLLRATLTRGTTLGVSNQMLGEGGAVSAEEGFLAIALTRA